MTANPTDTTICRTGIVSHSHDMGDNSHILCLETCDCGNPSILPVLFNDNQTVTLTISAPDNNDPRAATSDHPRVTVHINPSDEFGHDSCLIFDACGPCHTQVWESIFANGGGRIGVHAFPEDPDQVLFANFRIEDWKQTRAAIKTAQSRITPN